MRALVLQHVPFEGSARIGDWIGRHCEHEHVCYLYADARLPALDSFDLLVVMGGPIGGKDNGAPGLRPHHHPDHYAAFVIDPDGHDVEAVYHRPEA